MIEPIADVAPQALDLYDDIIDVRSPAEFAEDRLPRAINLPVLSNEERAEVGTIYTQESKFKARRIGAGLVAKNIARHLETALADRPPKWRPLLYCWRGGMRSHAMATILSQIGWRVGVLDGGYKTWRRAVVGALHGDASPFTLVLLDGQTGTAKSEILRRATTFGAQALDLEEMAAHRGSVFGALTDAQPSQRLFESRIFAALSRFDPARAILVEAESAQIGRCAVPRRLWRSMRLAPCAIMKAAPRTRAQYLVRAYGDIIARPHLIAAAIERLRPFHSKETIESWRILMDARDFGALAEALMREHYDPLYDRSRKRRAGAPVLELSLAGLAPADIDIAARQVAAMSGLQRAATANLSTDCASG